jgi:flagellar motor switch protein FliM
MSEILSQDEVDALLKAVSDGSVSAPAAHAGEGGGIRSLDLTNRERTLKGRLPGLEAVLERLGRDLRSSLAPLLGQVPVISLEAVELVKFETARERCPQPVALALFRLAPLRGHGLLALKPETIAALLHTVCGGAAGRPTAPPTREYTPIELRLIERLATRVLADLREAWRVLAHVDFGLTRIETNPLFATIAEPQDLVLHVELRMTVEGFGDGGLSIYVPNASLDPVRAALAAARSGDDAATGGPDVAWLERLRARLADVPVQVAVELGTQRVALSRVLALKVGDLVTLDTGREGPVVVRVAGRPHFVGAPGVSSGNNAVRVTGRC